MECDGVEWSGHQNECEGLGLGGLGANFGHMDGFMHHLSCIMHHGHAVCDEI